MNDMPYNTIKQLARQAINDTAKEIAMNVSQDFWVPRGIPMSSFDESIKLYFIIARIHGIMIKGQGGNLSSVSIIAFRLDSVKFKDEKVPYGGINVVEDLLHQLHGYTFNMFEKALTDCARDIFRDNTSTADRDYILNACSRAAVQSNSITDISEMLFRGNKEYEKSDLIVLSTGSNLGLAVIPDDDIHNQCILYAKAEDDGHKEIINEKLNKLYKLYEKKIAMFK